MTDTTFTPTESTLLTSELARIENAHTTLQAGAIADYLLTRFPTLRTIDASDASDGEGPFLYIEATRGQDGTDISDVLDPEDVMDYLGNYGVTFAIAEAWTGRIDLREAIAAARALLPATVCRHCGQEITPDVENDWIHVESEGVYCGLPINRGNDDAFTAEPTAD